MINDLFSVPGKFLKPCPIRDPKNQLANYSHNPAQHDGVNNLFKLTHHISKRSFIKQGVT